MHTSGSPDDFNEIVKANILPLSKSPILTSLYTVAQAMGKGSPFAETVDEHTREQAEILVELAFPTDFEALAFKQTQERMKAEEASGVPLDLDDLLIPNAPTESFPEDDSGDWE